MDCIVCRKEITEDINVYDMPTCRRCQRKMFLKFKEENGVHMAIYFMCGMNNVVCVPKLAIDLQGTDVWFKYLDKLCEAQRIGEGFFEGTTNFRMIFGRKLTETDFAKYVAAEEAEKSKLPGTEEQRQKWGVEDDFTTEAYNEFDRQYNIKISSYSGVTVTDQMEDTIRKVCVWNWRINQYLKQNDVENAKKLLAMVETVLSSEQMRKKDEKPQEQFTIDAQISALEKAGFVEQGKFKGLEDTAKAIRELLKTPKSDFPLDAVDQMILINQNAFRANAELALENYLPEEQRIEDEWEEFPNTESEDYEERKKFIGLLSIDKKGDN